MTDLVTDRLIRCRYLRRNNAQCTAEAVDPDGQVLLCTKHLARALQLIRVHLPAQQGGPGR
ncbi:hypothetical protein ACIBBG_16405 [Micromonospora chersina]|uniref:hypothetical protein n=1 Tax=Micromonospora chersina TaxID=47854 RepID=UPI00378E3C8E